MEKITLKTLSMQGEIFIGESVLNEKLPALMQGQKNFVLTDSNVFALYPDFFKKYFKDTQIFVLKAGEESKTFSSLGDILSAMVKAGLHRTSRLFAVGGGVIGDIGGLAAALYMRGISCVQIPTTLLSQVDSSVGGKTAVDHENVKNIVGAFFQPQAVLIDPNFLQTLPLRERKCGVGEIVKYAALSGEIFDMLDRNVDKLNDLSFLTGLITACVRHKARVVECDEKEINERKSLNVGHTTGHALELFYGLSHGESVLYGMWIETQMAIEYGVCEKEYGEKLLKIIQKALKIAPLTHPDFSKVANATCLAKADKKNTGDKSIVMAVAKKKNEWTLFSLPFEEYQNAVIRIAGEK